ncbi:MAG: radical SAM protein [Nitrospirae bacterium]|nr:MAG: radical SAM protein [Nitrospirota bacterium]
MHRFLLINPWIYDFAAVNMWARPLGLFRVAEALSRFDVELYMIDCLDSYRLKRFNMGKYTKTPVPRPGVLKDFPRRYSRYGITTDEFTERLRMIPPVDAVFITSVMTYWYPGVFEVIRIVKEFLQDTPVILGGIYATLFRDHAVEHSGANLVVSGQIEGQLSNVLSSVGISLYPVKQYMPWYKLGFYRNLYYAPILTSRGCPFRCSYCASSVLQKGFYLRDPDDVVKEIIDLAAMGVQDFAFYDDALLYRAGDHILPILGELAKRNLHIRFHTPNGLHARFISEEIARLMKVNCFETIRLSLETSSPERQKETGGKVTNEQLEEAVTILKKVGFTKEQIGVYLMYGLPGQSFEEVREGVEYLMELGVRIYLAEFSPIPGTTAWSELISEGVIKEDIDPIITNNSVFSLLFSGYPHGEIQKLKDRVNNYNHQI